MPYDYSYDEVRSMLAWELTKQARLPARISDEKLIMATVTTMTDDVLKMWENAGLTSRKDFQRRVEKYRAAKSHGELD